MNARRRLALLVLVAAGPAAAVAAVHVEGTPEFQRNVQAALVDLERSSVEPLKRLVTTLRSAPADVTIRALTADRATWNKDGDEGRGHTEPVDRRNKNRGRDRPTGAIVYIPANSVKGGSEWKSGVFAHELVHAHDLVTGRYHTDVRQRERRAVFFQNLWRYDQGLRLRASYHGKFETTDFQTAHRAGSATVARYADHVFRQADFPPK